MEHYSQYYIECTLSYHWCHKDTKLLLGISRKRTTRKGDSTHSYYCSSSTHIPVYCQAPFGRKCTDYTVLTYRESQNATAVVVVAVVTASFAAVGMG